MRVIARTSNFIVGSVAFLMTPTVIRAFMSPTLVNITWVLLGAGVVYRVALITVAVNDEWVSVRNFFKTTHIPIWEAELELGEPEASVALSDMGGKLDRGGRMLYINRTWNNERIHVGVAPRFGKELVRIHDELDAAIRAARAG